MNEADQNILILYQMNGTDQSYQNLQRWKNEKAEDIELQPLNTEREHQSLPTIIVPSCDNQVCFL